MPPVKVNGLLDSNVSACVAWAVLALPEESVTVTVSTGLLALAAVSL